MKSRVPSVLWLILLIGLCLVLPGCVPAPQPLTERNAALTQGNIQMHLVVGQTTKAEVLETFGAPNITTRDGSGRESGPTSGPPRCRSRRAAPATGRSSSAARARRLPASRAARG